MTKTDEGNPVRHLHSFQPWRNWGPRASLQRRQPDSDSARRQVDPGLEMYALPTWTNAGYLRR
jgi:hypothetical protein